MAAFISWQEAICALLSKDFTTARVKLGAVSVGAFLPLGPAGDFIQRTGGTELSMEPRRTTSKELYCMVWFLRSLAAKAAKQEDEASKNHNSTVHYMEDIKEDDLILRWFLYAARLLERQKSEALRIELEHRTRNSVGTKVVLEALSILLAQISREAVNPFASTVAAAVEGST